LIIHDLQDEEVMFLSVYDVFEFLLYIDEEKLDLLNKGAMK